MSRPWYAWQLLASFGLVSLLAPGVLVIAAGPFASNILSTFVFQHRLRYHYGSLLLPVLVTAAVYGIARAATFRAPIDAVRQGPRCASPAGPPIRGELENGAGWNCDDIPEAL